MDQQQQASVSEFFALVVKRRAVLLFVAVPIVALATGFALGLPDKFESEARFRLVAGAVADTTGRLDDLLDQYVYGLTEKVLSDDNLRKLAADSVRMPESVVAANDVPAYLRNSVRVEMITQTVLEPGAGRERNVNTGFKITVEDPVPETAALIATAVSDSFVKISRTERLELAASRQAFFNNEEERLRDLIAGLEKQLAEYKSDNFARLPETIQANTMIRGRLEQEYDNIDREIRAAERNRIFLNQQLRTAQTAPVVNDIRQLESELTRKVATYSPTHPDVIALRRQIELLRSTGGVVEYSDSNARLESRRIELAEARQRYSENHPDIKRLTREIELLQEVAETQAGGRGPVLDTAVSVQLQTQLNATNTELASLRSRLGALSREIGEIDQQLAATPEVERGYAAIAREIETARTRFRAAIEERMKSEVTTAAIESGEADRFALVSEPKVTGAPSGPKRLSLFFVGIIGALIVAFGSVLGLELVDSRVRGSRDIHSVLGVSPFIVIPVIQTAKERQRSRMQYAAIGISGVLILPTAYLYASWL